MSKANDFDENMAEIYAMLDEQTEFREKFIEDLLQENYELKEKVRKLSNQVKFLLREATRK
jgi:hypothetical protein